jgi:hypothetical protein
VDGRAISIWNCGGGVPAADWGEEKWKASAAMGGGGGSASDFQEMVEAELRENTISG